MDKTYEIPTSTGTQTVTAPDKATALRNVQTSGATLNLKVPQTIDVGDLTKPSQANVPAPITNQTNQTNLGITAGRVAGGGNDVPEIPTPDVTSIDGVKDSGTLASFFKNLIGAQGEKGADTAKLQQEQDIAGKKEAINKINKDILLRTKAYDDQIKQAEKNIEGKFGGAVQQDINALTRLKNEELANLGIQKAVALGDLDTANSIVADKIAAKFEPIENQIKSLEQLFSIYQNDMTEKEKMEAQLKIDEQKAARDQKADAYARVLQTISTNQAVPQSVIKAVDEAAANPNSTVGDIYAAAGGYMVKPEKVSQTGANLSILASSPNNTLKFIGQAAQNLSNSIYSTAQRENFVENVTGAVASGDLEAARRQISTMAYNKLGTQAKGDYDLYENAMSISGYAASLIDNGVINFGPYKSWGEAAKPYFLKSKDQSYVQARQAIELAQAQIRKGFYGTAVTSTEAGNAGQFLITDKDDIETVATKLKGYSNFLKWANDATIARAVGAEKPDINDYMTTGTTRALRSPDGTQEVDISQLTEEQIKEAKDAGWK